jgi:hypothetical protein
MRVVIRWGFPISVRLDRSPKVNRPPQKLPLTREERIRDIMLLALSTAAGRAVPHYLELKVAIRQSSQPETFLDRFPVTAHQDYVANRDRYLNTNSGEPGFRRFEHTFNPPPRTAILMEGFIETEKVMCFREGWCKDLEHFRPECLAGPVTMLRRMATNVFNRGAYFPSLRRPVLAFTGLPFGETALLTDHDRDQFWKAYGVPVFEYFLGYRHEVLARECDAQSGLHIDPLQAVFETIDRELIVTSLANTVFPVVRLASGLSGTISHEPCPCGYRGPRLLNVRVLEEKPRVRAAAAASGSQDAPGPPPHPETT